MSFPESDMLATSGRAFSERYQLQCGVKIVPIASERKVSVPHPKQPSPHPAASTEFFYSGGKTVMPDDAATSPLDGQIIAPNNRQLATEQPA